MTKDEEKANRLAEALRQNLRRRKAQAWQLRSAKPAEDDRHADQHDDEEGNRS
jgi:hypothetical protein